MDTTSIVICFMTEEEMKILQMIWELSTYEHPKNPFFGQTPETIIKAILRDDGPYKHWQYVRSTLRSGGAAKE